MAEASDDQATSICNHCDRAIPSSNIDLHFAHCSRNLEKCKVCGDMVPRKLAKEHFLSTHAPICDFLDSIAARSYHGYCYVVYSHRMCKNDYSRKGPKHQHGKVSCSLCSETMDRDILDVHKGENCPQRIVTCDYCEFPLPAVDLLEHQEVCGNRTELCHLCHKYIRLRERHGHESRCTGLVNNIAESSRNIRPPERARDAPRRQPQEFSPRRLLFTIAITGIAVLLGSLFFQRKPDPSQVN